jgi:hypothetical protein
MMRSSIVSLERAMGADAEGQPTSRNVYVTTGRGGQANVDLNQLWRTEGKRLPGTMSTRICYFKVANRVYTMEQERLR